MEHMDFRNDYMYNINYKHENLSIGSLLPPIEPHQADAVHRHKESGRMIP